MIKWKTPYLCLLKWQDVNKLNGCKWGRGRWAHAVWSDCRVWHNILTVIISGVPLPYSAVWLFKLSYGDLLLYFIYEWPLTCISNYFLKKVHEQNPLPLTHSLDNFTLYKLCFQTWFNKIGLVYNGIYIITNVYL